MAYRKDCGPLGSRGGQTKQTLARQLTDRLASKTLLLLSFAEHEKLTTGYFATHVVPAGVAREQNRRFC